MCDTTSEISSLYSCAGPQSPTVLEFLQLQVTWPFIRKNRLVIWRQQLPFDRCRWCCLWRMQEACRRAKTYWIVYFYHVIAISSYCWSFEVLTFPWAFCWLSTLLLVQWNYNLSQKLWNYYKTKNYETIIKLCLW